MRSRFVLLAAVFALAACASSPGPVGSANYPALIAAALPAGETVIVSGPGTWTPNSRRIVEVQNTGDIIPSFAPWKDGVTAVTASGLSFAEWDRARGGYVVIKRIARDNIASAEIETEGRSCVLVVQEAADATFHVFEFTRGAMNDCARAREAQAALQS